MQRLFYLFGLVVAVAFGYWVKSDKPGPSPAPAPAEAKIAPSDATGGAAVEPAAPAAAAPLREETSADKGATEVAATSAESIEDVKRRLDRIAEAYASSRDFTAISGRDLSVQSHKWDQKLIQVDLSCFYADVDEFRCFSSQSRVDFAHLYPESARKLVERDCDTIDKAQTKKCQRTLRFTYEGFHEMDVGGFLGKITVAKAVLNLGAIMPAAATSSGARKKR